MFYINNSEFKENLLLTQSYCELQTRNQQKNKSEIFRSINSDYDGQPLFSFKQGNTNETVWRKDPIMDDRKNLYYKEIFDLQINKKKELINSLGHKAAFSGRISITRLDETVVDGASEAESEGLFDINDCPPIDTWIYLKDSKRGRLLFAWIPEPYIYLANKAIAVNCVDCIYWLESTDNEFKKLFFQIGKQIYNLIDTF